MTFRALFKLKRDLCAFAVPVGWPLVWPRCAVRLVDCWPFLGRLLYRLLVCWSFALPFTVVGQEDFFTTVVRQEEFFTTEARHEDFFTTGVRQEVFFTTKVRQEDFFTSEVRQMDFFTTEVRQQDFCTSEVPQEDIFTSEVRQEDSFRPSSHRPVEIATPENENYKTPECKITKQLNATLFPAHEISISGICNGHRAL